MHLGSNAAAVEHTSPIIAAFLPSFLLVLLLLLIVSGNRGREEDGGRDGRTTAAAGGQSTETTPKICRKKGGELSLTTTTKIAIQVLLMSSLELPVYRMSACNAVRTSYMVIRPRRTNNGAAKFVLKAARDLAD